MLVTVVVVTVGAVAVLIKVVGRNGALSCFVLAGGRVPVSVFIAHPLFGIKGVSADNVLTNRAGSVHIGVSRLVLGYAVSAGGCVPVTCFIGAESFLKGMSVIIVPSASVTNTVVVLVSMRSLVYSCYIVRAGGGVPMLLVIVAPGVAEGMLVVVIPFANIANSVIVVILVSAFKLCAALIAFKVGICILVIFTGELFLTLIASKVFILVLVLGAFKRSSALVAL